MKEETIEQLRSTQYELAMTRGDLTALAEIIKDKADQKGGDDFGYFLWRSLTRAADSIHGAWETVDRAVTEAA